MYSYIPAFYPWHQNAMNTRAGRYLGILVVPQYCNQTIRVAIVLISVKRYYRFRYYHGFTVSKNPF